MKYSIIIPTFNEEKLLPNLLKQLTNPELRKNFNYEIILSDAHSTDKTIEIASKLVDKIIENNSGRKQNIAIGRNEGAKAATGDILIFLNADITINNPINFFSIIKNKFENSQFVAMTCKVDVEPSEEKLSDKIFHIFNNNYFHLLNLMGVGMARGECQIIRKEIFWKAGANQEQLAAGEDFDLFMRIRKLGKVLFVNEVTIYESPRRYRKYGYWNISCSWFKNSVSVVLKNKSLDQEWEQVR